MAMMMTGPSICGDHPDREPAAAAPAGDFAASAPPCGLIARSIAPPVEAASFTWRLNPR